MSTIVKLYGSDGFIDKIITAGNGVVIEFVIGSHISQPFLIVKHKPEMSFTGELVENNVHYSLYGDVEVISDGVTIETLKRADIKKATEK